jgi:hypothetical protein
LILRVVRDNPGLGYERLEGEMHKLGFDVSYITIRNVMIRHGLPPAPERSSSSWRRFLNHYKEQFLSCDFFTVETLSLKTLYMLFFIEHATRQVYLTGCTAHPDATWVTQQARQMTWKLERQSDQTDYCTNLPPARSGQSLQAVGKWAGHGECRYGDSGTLMSIQGKRRVVLCLPVLPCSNRKSSPWLHTTVTRFTLRDFCQGIGLTGSRGSSSRMTPTD